MAPPIQLDLTTAEARDLADYLIRAGKVSPGNPKAYWIEDLGQGILKAIREQKPEMALFSGEVIKDKPERNQD